MRKKFLFICLSWLIALTANADNLTLYLTKYGLSADPNTTTTYYTTDTSIEEGTVVTIRYTGNDNTTVLSIYINGEVVSSGKIARMKSFPYTFTAKKNCFIRVEGNYAFNFSTNPNVYFTQDVAVTGVTLAPTTATLTLGETETLTLTPTVLPGDATDKSVTWSSSNEAVATVTNGVVTAVAPGTATITATATNGTADTSDDKTATCTVTVSPAGYGVALKSGTEDAASWQGKAGTGDYQSLPLTGVEAGTAVSVKYFGTKKVESVKAVKKGAPVPDPTPATTDLSTISADYQAKNGETLTGTLANNVKISIADGATVTLKDVNITNLGDNCDWAGINCPGDATLVLEGTNTVCAGRDGSGYNNYPGIYIAPDKTLTIQGDGTLTAYSNGTNPFGAGIGGGYDIACGNIVINSGTITATGGKNSAGIGGSNASCGNITINGGTVTATGGESGAGIGSGGSSGSCGNITISGGNITATGGESGAGIGGGENVSCGNITISGGTVEATGGELAAGIGGGCNNPVCGTITITSGVTSVTATKGPGASNSIGAGNGGTAITVTIEDGANVTQN